MQPVSRDVLLPHLRTLRTRLLELHPDVADDQQALVDLIDGQTSTLDALRSIARAAIEAAAFGAAIDTRIRELKARRDRFYAQSSACRDAVRDGLSELGLQRLVDAEFTASLRDAAPKVVVTDLEQLPDVYKRVVIEPKLLVIGKELKAGEKIPGATLAFGNTPTLTIGRT